MTAADVNRAAFLAEAEAVRPELHRYCARMLGSSAEGEDIVQDTLAKALVELRELDTLPPLRPWLFRIAHNAAIDALRRYERRMGEPLEAAMDLPDEGHERPDAQAERREALHLGVQAFLQLPPLQRSCVVLKDVLDHSVEEIAALLAFNVPAVKSALHRGRTKLREIGSGETDKPPIHPLLATYARLFAAHDWDGVRALLAEDVRLDVVSRVRQQGKAQVGVYYGRYAELQGWRVETGWLDGRPAIRVLQDNGSYFIVAEHDGEHVTWIRDYRHVGYIAQEAVFEPSA